MSEARRATADDQDPESREAGAAPAHQSMVRARHADANGVRGVSRRARLGVRLPVAAVPVARVQARPQRSYGAVALQPSLRVLPRAKGGARSPRSLRRVPALSIPRRPPRARGARRARLDAVVRAP